MTSSAEFELRAEAGTDKTMEATSTGSMPQEASGGPRGPTAKGPPSLQRISADESQYQTDSTDVGTSRSFASQSPNMASEAVVTGSSDVVYMASLGSLRLAEEVTDGKQVAASSSSEIFRSDVRNEWVDAVFGAEFFPRGSVGDDSTASPPLQGVGMARSGSYVCYTATIPARCPKEEPDAQSIRSSPSLTARNRDGDKVGLTLSRIPLGLYVGSVDALGEAYAAGVVPGSVLVDINGMGVLGEPSHKLLERVWQYEGHFASFGFESAGTVVSPPRSARNHAGSVHAETTSDARAKSILATERRSARGPVDGPVALRFIKDGHLYTAIFLTKAPFGISWAPCGNFALVQKSYAHAQIAGVRRGCIVASVNHRNVRNMDHQDAAIALKEAFNRGEKISILLAFTPAESRTAFYEKGGNVDSAAQGKSPPRTKTRKGSDRDSNLQHLEYGIGTLLNCVNSNYLPSTDVQGNPEFRGRMGRSFRDSGGVRRLATRVAAGDIPAPTGLGKRTRSFDSRLGGAAQDAETPVSLSRSRTNAPTKIPSPTNSPTYSAMPTISNEELLDSWSTIDSLVYCVRRSLVRQSTEQFLSIGGVICIENAFAHQSGAFSTDEEVRVMTLLEKGKSNVTLLKQCETDPGAVSAFDATLLQILTLLSSSCGSDGEFSLQENEEFQAKDETCEFDAFRSAVVPILVNLALQNDGLAHRLYFLVRSFFRGTRSERNVVALRDKLVLQHLQNLLSQSLGQRQEMEDAANQKRVRQVDVRTRLESFGQTREPTEKVSQDRMGEQPEVASQQKPIETSGQDIQLQISGSTEESFDVNQKKTKRRSVRKKLFRMLRTTSTKREGSTATAKGNSIPNGSEKVDEEVFLQGRPVSDLAESPEGSTSALLPQPLNMVKVPSLLSLFHNTERFLLGLDDVCRTIEGSLLKSFSQKITEWALQPWSMKETALSNVTAGMRRQLGLVNFQSHSTDSTNTDKPSLPILNPVLSSEVLFWVNPDDCFILPSAHFPLLLSFDVMPNENDETTDAATSDNNALFGDKEMLYRTQVQILSVDRHGPTNQATSTKGLGRKLDRAYLVHCTVGGQLLQTDQSLLGSSSGPGTFTWKERNSLSFETRSFWGAPNTAALRISSLSRDEEGVDQVALSDDQGMLHYTAEEGYCFIDLAPMWDEACVSFRKNNRLSSWQTSTVTSQLDVTSFATECNFDSAGEPTSKENQVNLTITARVTGEIVDLDKMAVQGLNRKRVLLYKHDDDMRQEMIAIQFLETCHRLLCASGLDLKVRTFQCLPVGPNRGFIEWVAGSVPLSEVCKPLGSGFALWGSSEGSGRNSANSSVDFQEGSVQCKDERKLDSSASKSKGYSEELSGLSPSSSGWCKYESLRSLRQHTTVVRGGGMGGTSNNPIQDFLRSAAFDSDAPYFIRKDVMDTYVKSCASYSVITYILGVGDRHLDNLLIHPNGHFLHCDYSFILGQDPKTYLPMRITEEMVLGMGGRDSDNYAKFISLSGAAFLALRQHHSVRVLLSLIRNMATSDVPDICSNQSPEVAMSGLRSRFRLELDDDEALSYIENLIETSIASKIWIAVDAIHSLGKHF